MENQNVIQLLDKWIKNLDMNMTPQVLSDMKATLDIIKATERKKKGKLFLTLVVPQADPNEQFNVDATHVIENRRKINEIVNFLNERYNH